MPDKIMCQICGKYPATVKDYRFIENYGLQGKTLSCKYCFDLNDEAIKKIIKKGLDPKSF